MDTRTSVLCAGRGLGFAISDEEDDSRKPGSLHPAKGSDKTSTDEITAVVGLCMSALSCTGHAAPHAPSLARVYRKTRTMIATSTLPTSKASLLPNRTRKVGSCFRTAE